MGLVWPPEVIRFTRYGGWWDLVQGTMPKNLDTKVWAAEKYAVCRGGGTLKISLYRQLLQYLVQKLYQNA